jgi:hypothetical protein
MLIPKRPFADIYFRKELEMKITSNCIPGLEQSLSLEEGKINITDKGYFQTQTFTFSYTNIKKVNQRKGIFYVFDVDNGLVGYEIVKNTPYAYYNSLTIGVLEGERTIYTWFLDKIERKMGIYGTYIKPLKDGNKVISLDMAFFEENSDIQSVQDWLEAHCTE